MVIYVGASINLTFLRRSDLRLVAVKGGSAGSSLSGTNSASGYAGYFAGRVHVTGTLSKGGGSFKIDHPLDPENKYLSHSFVESPDMMNIYNGNVTTDANGETEVTLPEWFETLNRDFRYQLTVIGQFAQAIVSEKVMAIASKSEPARPAWKFRGR